HRGTDQRGVWQFLRRRHRAARDAQQLCLERLGGQHRQRLRRRGRGEPDQPQALVSFCVNFACSSGIGALEFPDTQAASKFMPLFSDSVLDEVRNSVNIVSVVSEYVALRKRGRSHLARCPFHTEKTPSFNVHEEKQIFHCFGCGVGGDVFKFLTLIEHISFPEAVRLLASRSGITLAEPEPRFGAREEFDADVLRAAMKAACDFFHETLMTAQEGRAAKEYLERRGISPETIARCRLGYSPAGGDALLGRLKGTFT